MLRHIFVISTPVLLACAGHSEAGSNSDAAPDTGIYCDPVCGTTPYYVGSFQKVCTGDTVCGAGVGDTFYCCTPNSGQTCVMTNVVCGSCTFPAADGGACTLPTDGLASCSLADGGLQYCRQ
jgi:hypothetical protein